MKSALPPPLYSWGEGRGEGERCSTSVIAASADPFEVVILRYSEGSLASARGRSFGVPQDDMERIVRSSRCSVAAPFAPLPCPLPGVPVRGRARLLSGTLLTRRDGFMSRLVSSLLIPVPAPIA